MDNIKLFDKYEKRIGNVNTGNEDIQLGYRGGIWNRKMCHTNFEIGKRLMMEGMK